MATIVTGWVADHPAVHRENLLASNATTRLSLLRHPTYPFLADVSSEESALLEDLRWVAMQYLGQVKTLDPDVAQAVEYLGHDGPTKFGWLPITWPRPDGDPRGSFVVRRRRDGTELDRTIVLMAANRSLKGQAIGTVQGLGVGLRVVMHVGRATSSGTLPIRVTGLSVCELHRADDPQAIDHPSIQRLDIYVRYAMGVIEGISRLRAVNLSGVEFVTPRLLRITGIGSRRIGEGPGDVRTNAPTDATVFQWTVDLGLTGKDGEEIAFVSSREQEQVTHALEAETHHKLFSRDPASCGPGRDANERSPTRDAIDSFREHVTTLPAQLRDPRFEVRQSQIGDPQNRPENVQSIGSGALELRSDRLSAAQAYLRAQEFFDFLADVDLPHDEYFKFASLPLLMRHRAGFSSSPEGKSVRAQVRVVDPETSSSEVLNMTKIRPQLEVAFGSAALRHRSELFDDHGRRSAQPLGIAADPRWAWHEFGHVLSYAATGALEYQFAHSVGDALAAVLNDATSRLAGDGLYDGATYPWIPAGRRHDRDAAAGWCWCGRRNGLRFTKPDFPPLLYKGYVEEQMLSSSVFRFYRAIGGHPENESAVRTRAATATGYLLMRSALLLGPSELVPARSADALLSAMIDADIGTLNSGELFPGGSLHKVLRWSFERQGLFATADPGDYAEGYGQPPAVDVWVMDRRENADSGGYDRVVLTWPEDLTPEEEEEEEAEAEGPAWFADPKAGVHVANGDIRVFVRNRGGETATNVVVRAWAAPAVSGLLQWQPVGDATLANVPAGGCATASIAAGPSGGPRYLFVEVSTSDDRSNLDTATYLPCAHSTPPSDRETVRDLVANDNNLALRLIP
jgi:hypothetical protein